MCSGRPFIDARLIRQHGGRAGRFSVFYPACLMVGWAVLGGALSADVRSESWTKAGGCMRTSVLLLESGRS
jgi:hypothetical protein